MSTAAIVTKAVQDKYAGLTFTAPLPPLRADEMPLRLDADPTTGQIPPYLVVRANDGTVMEWLSGLDRIENVRIVLMIFAPTKAQASDIAGGVQFNGQPPNVRAGFDDALTLSLPAGYHLNKMERRTPGTVELERFRSTTARLEFQIVLFYDVEVYCTGDGS